MHVRLAQFALVVALFFTTLPAFADKRVALLIGNSEYRNVAALANPRNDVRLLKSVLDEAGFDEVISAFDLGQKDLIKALRAFTDKAADADIALIYYSGHGMEVGGVNYLVPVDATLASDIDVADETVTLDRVLQAIDGAKRLKLVILDACRSNPFVASMKIKGGHRAIDKGLAPVEPTGSDTLVAFAAKAGTPALDGDGSNSPFAEALARRLIAPGVDVQFALREVRDDVLAATHRQQEPFTYGSLGGTAIALSKEAPGASALEPARTNPDIAAAALHVAMAEHTAAALDAFLSVYPTGPLADIARNERERLHSSKFVIPSLERNTERFGMDYKGFDLSAADPTLCAQACASEARCAAFGYVIPGIQGPSAKCWLKYAVPPAAIGRNCCVSGVKSGQKEIGYQ